MYNLRNKKNIQIFLLVLIAVLTLGIGYASITAVNIIINGNGTVTVTQENFKVSFTEANITTGSGTASIDEDDATIAYFDVSGLSKVGDKAVATYTVKNESNGIGAYIQITLTSTNQEYFRVSEKIFDNQLQAGDETTVTMTVEMIKTPINSTVTTSIIGKLKSYPYDNSTMNQDKPNEEVLKSEYTYTSGPDKPVRLNEEFPNNVMPYTSFNSAIEYFPVPVALAHKIDNSNIVTESYVAFRINGVIYYLRGGITETSGDSPVYDENVRVLKSAFGEENCEEAKE